MLKKRLQISKNSGYSNITLAKSKGRICTLTNYLATRDAQSVFFCVNPFSRLRSLFSSMVAFAGHPNGWLVFQVASSANPVNVTANEICTSGGDCKRNYLEDAPMATTPILLNKKLFKFYDKTSSGVVCCIATTEEQARENLGMHSLIFIARIRLYPIINNAHNHEGNNHE